MAQMAWRFTVCFLSALHLPRKHSDGRPPSQPVAYTMPDLPRAWVAVQDPQLDSIRSVGWVESRMLGSGPEALQPTKRRGGLCARSVCF